MFEDALMESSGRIVTRTKYYTFLGALLNVSLLAALVLMPLLHPEALPKSEINALLIAPAPPPAPVTPPSVLARKVVPQIDEFATPTTIPKLIRVASDTSQPPSVEIGARGLGEGSALPGGILEGPGSANETPAVFKAVTPGRVGVSQGVMAGYILARPQPTYPAIARAARIEGTVILSATISKTGTIKNLSVVSGPQMLARSAIDAVRQWRYKPYLLNGEPVEVQTTVNVTFTLGGG